MQCKIAYSSLAILETGEMKICREMESIGSIRNMTPEQAWNGERAEEVRKRIAHCDRPCKVLNCNWLER
jgi:hypothetical protein